MSPNDLNSTAAGVLAEMRTGKLPSGSAAGDLDRLPIIDALRAAVGSDDRDWLLAAVENSDDRLAALAVSMLRRLIGDPVVFSAFERRWESASVYLRFRLLWRFLDVESLSLDWQGRLQSFVFSEFDEIGPYTREFYPPGIEGIEHLLRRLAEPTTSLKVWAYVANIPAVMPDPKAARALIVLCASHFKHLQGPFCDRLLSLVDAPSHGTSSKTPGVPDPEPA